MPVPCFPKKGLNCYKSINLSIYLVLPERHIDLSKMIIKIANYKKLLTVQIHIRKAGMI